MKRNIITTMVVLMAVALNAQNAHLKFKGIPIDGEYKAFAQQLVQKGFKQIESSPDGIILTGNFMATPGVMVVVYPDPTSKSVSAVSALVEAGDNWPTIEDKYYDVVATYKEKYGEPSEHVEEFTTDVHNEDFFRKNALHDGQCNYKSLWEVEGGHIVISLAYFQFKYYVVCAYADEQNVKALRKTIIDDI
ncbi:MAG: hypothetical protein J6Y61_04885 [Bacteroidales bacterium]|nr:hypothetical protein [Bacteroidales bacterium]